MHRLIRERLEQVLAAPAAENRQNATRVQNAKHLDAAGAEHLETCGECSAEIAAMREHAALLRDLRAPQEAPEPSAGFYARVLERIEAQAPNVWSLFFD